MLRSQPNNSSTKLTTNSLHHAYLVVGSKVEGEKHVTGVLDLLGLKKAGNPDFHAYRADSFDIESAREVREKAREKPFGQKKIFLISAERFTHQAQNALLKTFEEPSPHVHFFILLNAPDLLLPTLLSRMQVVRPELPLIKSSDENFLKLNLKDRLKFAQKFADLSANSGAGDEKSLPVFLDSLMGHIRENGGMSERLEKIFIVRRFADDPSKSSRLILEHLALVLN